MRSDLTVATRGGMVAGVDEDGLAVFKGVPFARPPVGPLRFRPPQPAEPWSGVRPADAYGRWAPQRLAPEGSGIGGEELGQDEDCLTLNVWTPAAGPGRRPVMVWVHGGAFLTGAGSGLLYRGQQLAARGDVVVVTVNYRLGALGFGAHPALRDPGTGACGNWGLLDQLAALRWVSDNISGFGGDPANVTVFGESAGAVSVGVMLGMPAARGLFAKAIAQSGGPGAATLSAGADSMEMVAGELGLPEVARDALERVPVADLLEAQGRVASRRVMGGQLAFLPVVDGAVVPRPPLEAIADGNSAGVPLLAGTNGDEMRFFAIADRAAFVLDEATLAERVERLVGPGSAPPTIAAYAAARSARNQPTTPSQLWFAIAGDHLFRVPAIRMAEAQAANGAPAYSYLFTWPSPVFDGVLGACHALELPFVFGKLSIPSLALFAGSGREAEQLSGRMQDAWLGFARTGDPSHPGIGPWPRYQPGRRATMVLDRTCEVVDAPLEAERAFWDARR